MTGLKISQPLSNEFCVGFSQKVPGKSPAELVPSRRSAPTQNALPSPVTIATHASSSSRKRAKAALRSRRNSPLIAFNASGRLYVMVATCPSSSYRTVSAIAAFLCYGRAERAHAGRATAREPDVDGVRGRSSRGTMSDGREHNLVPLPPQPPGVPWPAADPDGWPEGPSSSSIDALLDELFADTD